MDLVSTLLHLLSFYPFTWDQTLILVFVLKGLFDAMMKSDFKKAEQIIINEALPLVEQALDNETKRDLVVKALWQKAPPSFRAFIKPEDMEKLVDKVYVNVIKPQIRRKESVVQAVLAEQENKIEIARDANGRKV